MRHRFGFLLADFALVVVFYSTTTFLLYFYTDELLLSPLKAGVFILAAMFWDAVTDPLIAYGLARAKGWFSSYSSWIAMGSVPLAASFYLAFSSPFFGAVAPGVWALGTHLLLRLSYTIVSVPLNSLPARLTRDPHERSRIAAFRTTGVGLGRLLVITVLLGPAITGGGGQKSVDFATLSAFGALAAMPALLAASLLMKGAEREKSAVRRMGLGDWWRDLRRMLFSSLFRQLMFLVACGSATLTVFGRNMIYFLEHEIGRLDLLAPILLLQSLILIGGSPLWVVFARRMGKDKTLKLGLWIILAGLMAFGLSPLTRLWLSFAGIVGVFIGGAINITMMWSLIPDSVDDIERLTGVRKETEAVALITFVQKLFLGVSTLIFGLGLSILGYDGGAPHDGGNMGIRQLLMWIPAIGAIAMLSMMSTLGMRRSGDVTSGPLQHRPASDQDDA